MNVQATEDGVALVCEAREESSATLLALKYGGSFVKSTPEDVVTATEVVDLHSACEGRTGKSHQPLGKMARVAAQEEAYIISDKTVQPREKRKRSREEKKAEKEKREKRRKEKREAKSNRKNNKSE
eukprot:TRINITY_DN1222_c0_g1_i1.p2 TRINITY_DN1222_c0_g1~~TRINITY_DN1222_c0_g1_i1.p2  ORF type:complete len:126 (+),score=18.17 TRINITY_DN1222_c0_g1_i1:1150-1527(+)